MKLIVAEHTGGKLTKATLEMVAAAQNAGGEGPVTLLVLGQGVAGVANEAAQYAEQVLVGDSAALAAYNPEVWAAAAAQIAQEGEASLVMIGGSRSGREYAPRVAVKLDAPYLEDATSLSVNGTTVQAQRYTYLARVTETVEASAPTVIVTVKPGSFARCPCRRCWRAVRRGAGIARSPHPGHGPQRGKDQPGGPHRSRRDRDGRARRGQPRQLCNLRGGPR